MQEYKMKLRDPTVDQTNYRNCFACSIILSQDNRIVMQYRDHTFKNFPDKFALFGGHMEAGENPSQALVRELEEELNARVNIEDIILLGAFTEEETNHQDLIFVFFWHDKTGTISGCNEGEVRHFNTIEDVLAQPKTLNGDRWMLHECRRRGLL